MIYLNKYRILSKVIVLIIWLLCQTSCNFFAQQYPTVTYEIPDLLGEKKIENAIILANKMDSKKATQTHTAAFLDSLQFICLNLDKYYPEELIYDLDRYGTYLKSFPEDFPTEYFKGDIEIEEDMRQSRIKNILQVLESLQKEAISFKEDGKALTILSLKKLDSLNTFYVDTAYWKIREEFSGFLGISGLEFDNFMKYPDEFQIKLGDKIQQAVDDKMENLGEEAVQNKAKKLIEEYKIQSYYFRCSVNFKRFCSHYLKYPDQIWAMLSKLENQEFGGFAFGVIVDWRWRYSKDSIDGLMNTFYHEIGKLSESELTEYLIKN